MTSMGTSNGGRVKGKTVGIDATTLEANAALRSIVRQDTGEGYQDFLPKARASLWHRNADACGPGPHGSKTEEEGFARAVASTTFTTDCEPDLGWARSRRDNGKQVRHEYSRRSRKVAGPNDARRESANSCSTSLAI